MIVKCPQCGNLVSEKASFCPYCGTQLLTSHPQATKEIPQPAEPEPVTVPEPEPEPMPEPEPEPILEPESGPEPDKKKKKRWIIPVIISVVLLLAGGAIAVYFYMASPDYKLGSIPSLFDKQEYEAIAQICDEIQNSFSSLSDETKQTLADYYGQLARKTHKTEYKDKLYSFVKRLYDQDDYPIMQYLDDNFPDEVNHIRLEEAYELYTRGKVGQAKDLADKVSGWSNNLSFLDKCDLASLLGAIGALNGDYSCIGECIQLYTQTRAFSETEASMRFAENDERLHINIDQIVQDGYSAYNSNVYIIRSVVVNGTDVRVRRGPGLEYDPITDYRGKNIHPAKGQRLEYLGERDDFYNVRFRGYDCWISKQFTTPSDEPAN